MYQQYPALAVKVSGDLACFTRPEMKAERVSYPVITPTAARGVLEAIFWKPEFNWQVDEIQVLKPIRYTSFVRNEINTRQNVAAARNWQQEGGGFNSADSHNRAQRHTLALRDVSYIIIAQPVLKNGVNNMLKYREQFQRRLKSGRCFATPYLGCREFWAQFEEPTGDEVPINVTEDLGSMLGEMEYTPNSNGAATPHFFNARLVQGTMLVPATFGQGF